MKKISKCAICNDEHQRGGNAKYCYPCYVKIQKEMRRLYVEARKIKAEHYELAINNLKLSLKK
jgi:hypothetical protein